MPSLGSYGAAKLAEQEDADPFTFEFYGETFTVVAKPNSVAMLDMAEAASEGMDSDSPEGMAAVKQFIQSVVVKEQRRRFWKVAADNDSDGDELMKLAGDCMAAITGRPTSRPSDSADGSSETGESSTEPSFSMELSPLSPIQRDPRILELVPVAEAGAALSA